MFGPKVNINKNSRLFQRRELNFIYFDVYSVDLGRPKFSTELIEF